MDIILAVWCASLFFLAGLIIGRITQGREKAYAVEGNGEEGVRAATEEVRCRREEDSEETVAVVKGENRQGRRELPGIHFGKRDRRAMAGEKRIPAGWAIGSPVSGMVTFIREGEGKGAQIVPDQGKLHAPATGKITRLYPTGNAMRLKTDNGIELLIQAGVETEALEGRCYRPRIVQNEFVNKGKLLLEFDIEGIVAEGFDPCVKMSVVEAEDYRGISVCENTRVKVGEDLLWVRR